MPLTHGFGFEVSNTLKCQKYQITDVVSYLQLLGIKVIRKFQGNLAKYPLD